jgi:hypothetical protein
MHEQNEQYHTAKETIFWLSTTLHLGYSAYAMNWILTVRLRNDTFMFLVAIITMGVFITGRAFAKRQNWLKCLSVIKSEKYVDLMVEVTDDGSIRMGLRELDVEVARIETRPPKKHQKAWRKDNRRIWWKKGKPGSWLVLLLWLFFIAQLIAIVYRVGGGNGPASSPTPLPRPSAQAATLPLPGALLPGRRRWRGSTDRRCRGSCGRRTGSACPLGASREGG